MTHDEDYEDLTNSQAELVALQDEAIAEAEGAGILHLRAGMLVEGVIAGRNADGTPLTRTIRVRIDRAPWTDGLGVNVILCTGTGVGPVAVRADSIRVID